MIVISPLTYDKFDWDVAGRTLFGEARGEAIAGLYGVAWVIRNRVERPGWWGRSIQEVCRKPKQFSCWNDDDPNRDILLAVNDTNRTFRRCLGAVALVFSGDIPDDTHGATHYFTAQAPPWAREWPPAWIHGIKGGQPMVQTAATGAHLFYRDSMPGEVTRA